MLDADETTRCVTPAHTSCYTMPSGQSFRIFPARLSGTHTPDLGAARMYAGCASVYRGGEHGRALYARRTARPDRGERNGPHPAVGSEVMPAPASAAATRPPGALSPRVQSRGAGLLPVAVIVDPCRVRSTLTATGRGLGERTEKAQRQGDEGSGHGPAGQSHPQTTSWTAGHSRCVMTPGRRDTSESTAPFTRTGNQSDCDTNLTGTTPPI